MLIIMTSKMISIARKCLAVFFCFLERNVEPVILQLHQELKQVSVWRAAQRHIMMYEKFSIYLNLSWIMLQTKVKSLVLHFLLPRDLLFMKTRRLKRDAALNFDFIEILWTNIWRFLLSSAPVSLSFLLQITEWRLSFV